MEKENKRLMASIRTGIRRRQTMFEGYFLEIERYLAAAKFDIHFMEDEYGGDEEKESALENLDRARIALRDLIECISS
jgi:chaperone required for assembly of F1-ATPase